MKHLFILIVLWPIVGLVQTFAETGDQSYTLDRIGIGWINPTGKFEVSVDGGKVEELTMHQIDILRRLQRLEDEKRKFGK